MCKMNFSKVVASTGEGGGGGAVMTVKYVIKIGGRQPDDK